MNTPADAIARRLVIMYDGTWNKSSDNTNVHRFKCALKERDGEVLQLPFYDEGVGTGKWDRFRGGLMGYGLDVNLLQGYRWLCTGFTPGDAIYLIGFSRGAYTARSLGGMIRKCGVLRAPDDASIKAALKLYRNRKLHPDSDECVKFRESNSHETRIEMIGVWDTVGALGVPGTTLFKHKYNWHDTELSRIVKRAYQALALDEHRAAYESAPWTTKTGQKKPDNIDVEQRWFIGAHANVGGGYGNDPLACIALEWLQQKAAAAGLALEITAVPPAAHMTPPVDSLKEFAFGLYYLFQKIRRLGKARHYRSFDRDSRGNPAINVTVDDSVWKRWRADETYRPPTLVNAGHQPPQFERDVEFA